MTYSELVRLKMTPKDVDNFNPLRGVDVTWLDYDYYQGEVTARMIASEFHPDPKYIVFKENLDKFINDLPVSQDGVRWSKHEPESLRRVEGFINDPNISNSDDSKRSSKDARYVELTKEELANLNNDMKSSGRKSLKPDKTVERNGIVYYLLSFGTLEDN
jgi:hypothetical protein